MDVKKTTEGNMRTENPDGDNQKKQYSLVDYAAVVSGLVILFGGLTYALGLVVLWVPIWRVQTHDLGTAWHATFLVPRAYVAGLGVRQLVAFPLLMGLLLSSLTFTAVRLAASLPEAHKQIIGFIPPYLVIVLYTSWRINIGSSSLSQASFFAIFVLVMLLIALPYLIVFAIAELRGREYGNAAFSAVMIVLTSGCAYLFWRSGFVSRVQSLQRSSVDIDALVNFAFVVGAGTIVLGGAMWAGVRLLDSYPESGDRMWAALRALIPVLAAAFIAAFMLTVPSKPPLPMVEISTKDKNKDAVGRLLAHTDGFWYVFEEQDDQSGSRLTAIPDDDAKRAWISKVPE